MKIFWSWQSDTPGKIGRHFVRGALESALKELNEESTIEERLELDHDRKGVPGSPDLVTTILKKIDQSDLFIADVTPVGKSVDEKRALLNPNVAIELGYALAKLGDERLLMVLNHSFGDRESLPFDLRHKAGPIIFNLSPNGNKVERSRVLKELTQTLKQALKVCLPQLENRQSTPLEEIPSSFSVAQYFADGEVLDERQNQVQLRYKPGSLLYLRLIPTRAMQPLRNSQIKDLVFGIKLKPLNVHTGGGGHWGTNRFGGITYDFDRSVGLLLTSSQIFHNRELWGIDAALLNEDKKYIPSHAYEETLDAGLRHYVQFAAEKLNIDCPVRVKAGISRANGFKMAMPHNMYLGPVHERDIQSSHSLQSFEEREINRVLIAIFEDFFDAVGEHRPANFRDFPPVNEPRQAGA